MSENPYMLENTRAEFERTRDVAARRHAAEIRALAPPSAAVRPSPDSEAVARVEALAESFDKRAMYGGALVWSRIRAALGTGDREGADRG